MAFCSLSTGAYVTCVRLQYTGYVASTCQSVLASPHLSFQIPNDRTYTHTHTYVYTRMYARACERKRGSPDTMREQCESRLTCRVNGDDRFRSASLSLKADYIAAPLFLLKESLWRKSFPRFQDAQEGLRIKSRLLQNC